MIVSLQTTIYPSKDIYVREGSTARFSCSFPSPGSDALSLSVGGLKPLVVVLTGGVVADKINQSQVLGVLGGSYTVLVVTTSLAEIEFTFSATPALDGYTLQCISKNRFDASAKDNVSQIITIHVECTDMGYCDYLCDLLLKLLQTHLLQRRMKHSMCSLASSQLPSS